MPLVFKNLSREMRQIRVGLYGRQVPGAINRELADCDFKVSN